jgi:hypothetical protein
MLPALEPSSLREESFKGPRSLESWLGGSRAAWAKC